MIDSVTKFLISLTGSELAGILKARLTGLRPAYEFAEVELGLTRKSPRNRGKYSDTMR